MDKWVAKNAHNEPLKVFHAKLLPLPDAQKEFKRECPFCFDGVLAGSRDAKSKIKKTDHCLLCGQKVIYLDIKNLLKEFP